MTGGLLNIQSYGNPNIILNGNPSKTMFKTTYAKYTNFGMQKFRLDYEGQRSWRLNEPTSLSFKVPRHADLLMDTHLVVTLPHIWSPILPPNTTSYPTSNVTDPSYNADLRGQWRPYDFKWIENLGSQMIKEVRFIVGGQIIQKFSGQYLYNLVERDFDEAKKKQYYKMTGNVPELNDPANSGVRENVYPNAYFEPSENGPEPSIRSRKIYIPLNIWFTLSAKMAFPLISLQYNPLYIEIDLRPVNELYVVRNIRTLPLPGYGEGEYIQANQNDTLYQFYRFIHPPPNVELDYDLADKRVNLIADIHLISTYAFLSEDEQAVFAQQQQQYLIKEVYEHKLQNVNGTSKMKLDSLGMIANWMWYFQRSDAIKRNQWSNYSNWPYEYLPSDLKSCAIEPSPLPTTRLGNIDYSPGTNPIGYGSGVFNIPSSIYITGSFAPDNSKHIMRTWGLLLDGKYRETTLDEGILSYVEKYTRNKGCSDNGLYCYNFNISSNPCDFQPSGAINLSKFKEVEFEFSTIEPPINDNPSSTIFCDGDGNVIGINKPAWNIHTYNFDITVMEERFNVLTFISGNASLMYAR